MWLWSEKPQRVATSDKGDELLFSSCFARSARRRRTKAPIVSPVRELKVRARWVGCTPAACAIRSMVNFSSR